jgi:hypothetical protein
MGDKSTIYFPLLGEMTVYPLFETHKRFEERHMLPDSAPLTALVTVDVSAPLPKRTPLSDAYSGTCIIDEWASLKIDVGELAERINAAGKRVSAIMCPQLRDPQETPAKKLKTKKRLKDWEDSVFPKTAQTQQEEAESKFRRLNKFPLKGWGDW